MKFRFIAVIVSCLPLAACSAGPKDEDVVNLTKAFGATRGMVIDSVKNLGCEKAKEGEGEGFRGALSMQGGNHPRNAKGDRHHLLPEDGRELACKGDLAFC